MDNEIKKKYEDLKDFPSAEELDAEKVEKVFPKSYTYIEKIDDYRTHPIHKFSYKYGSRPYICVDTGSYKWTDWPEFDEKDLDAAYKWIDIYEDEGADAAFDYWNSLYNEGDVSLEEESIYTKVKDVPYISSDNPKADRVYNIMIKPKDSSQFIEVNVEGYDYGSDVKDTVKKVYGEDVKFSSLNPFDFWGIEEFSEKSSTQEALAEKGNEEIRNKLIEDNDMKDDVITFWESDDYGSHDFDPYEEEMVQSGLVICGNRDKVDMGAPDLIDLIKKYHDVELVLAALKKATGKTYKRRSISGYTQGDWNILFYPEGTSEELLDTIEDMYMGNYTIYYTEDETVDPDYIYVLHHQLNRGTDVEDVIAQETGLPADKIKIKQISGYSQDPIYEEKNAEVNKECKTKAIDKFKALDDMVDEAVELPETVYSVSYIRDGGPYQAIMVKADSSEEAERKVADRFKDAEIIGSSIEYDVDEMKKRGKPLLEEIEDDISMREWYVKTFPNDDLGQEIDPSVTFNDLQRALDEGVDVYKLIGVGDSIVRERLFDKLADLTGVAYDDIYEKWVNAEEVEDQLVTSIRDRLERDGE